MLLFLVRFNFVSHSFQHLKKHIAPWLLETTFEPQIRLWPRKEKQAGWKLNKYNTNINAILFIYSE